MAHLDNSMALLAICSSRQNGLLINTFFVFVFNRRKLPTFSSRSFVVTSLPNILLLICLLLLLIVVAEFCRFRLSKRMQTKHPPTYRHWLMASGRHPTKHNLPLGQRKVSPILEHRVIHSSVSSKLNYLLQNCKCPVCTNHGAVRTLTDELAGQSYTVVNSFVTFIDHGTIKFSSQEHYTVLCSRMIPRSTALSCSCNLYTTVTNSKLYCPGMNVFLSNQSGRYCQFH